MKTVTTKAQITAAAIKEHGSLCIYTFPALTIYQGETQLVMKAEKGYDVVKMVAGKIVTTKNYSTLAALKLVIRVFHF
ncbi:MAG: hypothetical protein COA47_10290 [Robiginitomaculum sp.]|nr:MAG: hypothetical protein COA47_10290 [Robiginitomaculum sp.]